MSEINQQCQSTRVHGAAAVQQRPKASRSAAVGGGAGVAMPGRVTDAVWTSGRQPAWSGAATPMARSGGRRSAASQNRQRR